MKTQPATELQIASPMIVETVNLFNRMEEIQQQLARRAYELFEERGRDDGHDQEDWLRAESELLSAIAIEMVETASQLRVSVDVTGFSEKDIEISVEPRRLFISGKKQEAIDPGLEEPEQPHYSSMMFFRALDLPARVEPEKTNAVLKGEMLKLTLAKAVEPDSPGDEPAQ